MQVMNEEEITLFTEFSEAAPTSNTEKKVEAI